MCTGYYVNCSPIKDKKAMKAKTKLQRQLLEMRKELPELTDSQKNWAIEHCFERIGYYWKRDTKVWCQCCGHEDRVTLPELMVSLEMTHVCPECGRPLTLKGWQKERKFADGKGVYESTHYSVVTNMEGWTVIRTFEVNRNNYMGDATHYGFWEVYQNWLSDDGREVILSKGYSRSPSYFRWNHYSEWGVGRHNEHCSGYYVMSDVYDVDRNYFYPRQSVSPVLRRNGWKAELLKRMKVGRVELMQMLLTEPLAEELVKKGQYNVLAHWMKTGDVNKDRTKWLHAVRICIRNNYQIKDASMFFDYLDLLEYFHKDTHNAKYVCPENLRTEHDRLLMKKDKKELARTLAKRIAQAGKFEGQYKEHRGMFFGICFGNDDIMVTVIGSVKEMAEEGTWMHHCVFANGYYDHKSHPDSLILSAKDRDGNRLETVEVNMKTWTIVQSRGRMNKPTPEHGDIVKLVEKNMYRLRQAV